MITYNHEKYIAEAIEGVLMQEVDFEVELIIADDCSTDRTGEIVHDYIEHHPRGNWIKYTRHQSNLGMMPNFIWALKACQGKYIALCEGDDYWSFDNKLAKQISFLNQNSSYSFSFHDCNVIKNGKLSSGDKYWPQPRVSNLNSKDILSSQFVPTCSVVFKTLCLPKKLPDEFIVANNGDRFLFFLLSLCGPAHYFKGAYFGNYRIHSEGFWSKLTRLEKHLFTLNSFLLINRIDKPKFLYKYIWKKISHLSYELGKDYSVVDKSVSRYFFWMSIVYSINSFQFKVFLYASLKMLKSL